MAFIANAFRKPPVSGLSEEQWYRRLPPAVE